MNKSAIIQSFIAVIALLFGYPYLGNIFIVAMIPLVLFMLIKQDARYLPALMLHCASETSIYYLVFFTVVFICLAKARVLFANKQIRIVFILLLLSFPLYVVLTYQKLIFDNLTWQASLHYSYYYLSFWAFLYCYLIAKSFDKNTVVLLLFSLLFVFIGSKHIRLASMILYLGVVYGIFMFLHSNNKLIGLMCAILSLVLFFVDKDMTFTELFTMIYATGIYILYESNKKKIIRNVVGWLPFVLIIILMIYGINNYQIVQFGDYSSQMDFSSWEGFWNRALYKFFGDRALFWSGAWEQLKQLKPFLPMHNIPNIVAIKADGKEIDNIAFGAHNTPLQLFRIFGFLMGGALTFCYLHYTMLSATIFRFKTSRKWIIPLISVSITNSIVLFLTGTATMTLGFALFSFGLMGIAYGLIKK